MDEQSRGGFFALKGHGFSRAVEAPEVEAALAAEGMLMTKNLFPQGLKLGISFARIAARLKPCPFKTKLTGILYE
jgi:hypothetical protein